MYNFTFKIRESNNSQLKKFLYLVLSFLFLATSDAQKLKKLGIEFESTSYNFGDIQMWENQPAIFQLTNHSKHAISILPLFSENDLEIIYPDRSIAPGETVIIKAIYYTSGTGSFSRKFPIYFNTSPEAYELKITGNIKSLSPTAYIQCPQAKPEHSKPKLELVGNVAELHTEIPLSGSEVKIIALSSKGNTVFYSDKNGNFGSKMPTGNYEVIVEHPNYKPHQSFFFLGQSTGYLKIRLEPIEEVLLAVNPTPVKTPEKPETMVSKESGLPSATTNNPPSKVVVPPTHSKTPLPSINEEEISLKNEPLSSTLGKENPEKVASYTPPTTATIPPPLNEEAFYTKEATISSTPSNTKPPSQVATAPVNPPTSNSVAQEVIPGSTIPASKQYTVRILDEKTLEPIGDAQLYVTAILDKKQTLKIKSDDGGLASFPLKKEDYKLIVNADNYISGEAKIRAGQDDDIIRIYLSPVSDLFENIYEQKKASQEPNELLSQFSFGKPAFSFQNTEEIPVKKEEEPVATNTTKPIVSNHTSQETIVPTQTDPNPSLAIIAENPINTNEKEQLKLDSIQSLYAEIQAEKQAMQEALAAAETRLNQQNELLALQEEEIKKKETALTSTEKKLDEVKTQYTSTEKELVAKKEALENIEKTNTAKLESAPENYELSKTEYAANNVLFLIDVSSSMGKENKMELLKESIKSLTLVLRDIDRVAIIAYNQKTSIVLESVNGNNKALILNAIDSLQTSGLTYGVNGLQTAYELLQYYYIGDGNNQIILATDGLFSSANATMTESELNKEVRQQASNNGIRLSVIGFGQDEEGEKLMQKLANNGEGQFIQIKNPWEARTVLVDEIKLNSKL